MLRRVSIYLRQNVLALLALFIAVGTGGAYAANTIGSADIIDGEVKSVDIANDSIHSGDILDNTINTFDVHSFLGVDVVDGSLTGADIANESIGFADIGSSSVGPDEVINDSLLQSDIRAGAVTNDEVLNNTLIGADVNDNSLTGADINEATLAMPPTTTATFAGQGNVSLPQDGSFAKVTGKTLPAGSYAIAATANVQIDMGGEDFYYRDTACELRNTSGGFIGGGRDRRYFQSQEITTVSLSMNAGAQVPGGGGEVSLWCRFQDGAFSKTADGQMMIIRLDGFF